MMLLTAHSIKTRLSNYIDLSYFFRFFCLLIILHYFNLFYFSIIDKKGLIYIPFLDNHVNYISWLRNSILYTSNLIVRLTGTDSYVSLPFHLKTVNGNYVQLVYSCLGLGLMSFWTAFVVGNNDALGKKILWCIIGLVSIWFINCVRIAVLLLAFQRQWPVNRFIDHHSLFNMVAYSLIFFLIYFYLKSTKNTRASL